MAGNLRRTPALGKQLGDDIAELRISLDTTWMATCSAHHGPAMGFKRSVGAVAPAIASQLPRHRRRCSADLVGDLADAKPVPPQIGDLDAFVAELTGKDSARRSRQAPTNPGWKHVLQPTSAQPLAGTCHPRRRVDV